MPRFRGHKASHSRSTSSPSGLGYDVFLSFRGEDTRKNFTDHLYTALVNAHFRTFRDDPELERGENIKENLENAIRQSWSSVIVFSKDYTSSRWCLDELVLILGRMRTSKHVVLPVFYDVNPHQLGKQAETLSEHPKYQEKQSPEKLSRWKEALREVTDLAGMVLENEADGHESKFIQKIVGEIQKKLDRVVDSLSATAGHNSSLLSPSGDFAFGFRQLENSENFLLSIWFAKIPDRTIVWYANGDRPAPKGSIVNLTSSSGLVLKTPQGEQLWKSDLAIAGVVAYGDMNDNGNFILEDKKSEKLWETFKNPTDTMLPGQIIERGGRLSSRQSETNYARGRFLIDFQEDGNLVFSAKKPFHSTKTTTGTVPGSEGKQLVFDDSGKFYILRVNGGEFTFTAEKRPAMDYYLRSTVNFDGVLVQYFLPKSSVDTVSWKPLWSEPDNTSKENPRDAAGSFLSILIFLCSVLSFWFRKTTKMCLDEIKNMC
ncbi:G-type lectin S-receptor-like serine/threonine-protein kinase RLK1 [Rosa rugosa]|uniref:G-type lectin S-receptor-like serine/threonine-protein kinase RLK1 n=1 Tax=Rosa rugosa TaxID=74645 RepID=UPI002B40BB19|nr:G-type lectin S-receptor-like serine/threonine-protein kinase RLK1 [Rosa rugosa]